MTFVTLAGTLLFVMIIIILLSGFYTKKRMIDEMKLIGVLKVCGYSKKLLSKISPLSVREEEVSTTLSKTDQVYSSEKA